MLTYEDDARSHLSGLLEQLPQLGLRLPCIIQQLSCLAGGPCKCHAVPCRAMPCHAPLFTGSISNKQCPSPKRALHHGLMKVIAEDQDQDKMKKKEEEKKKKQKKKEKEKGKEKEE